MLLSFRLSLTLLVCGLLPGCALLPGNEIVFEGNSMLPSIKNGQKLHTKRIGPELRSGLRRGDILVFKYPEDPSKFYIKRLIGMPGETVEIQAGQLLVNGIKLPEPYIDAKLNLSRRVHSAVVVPARSYYVLGDNRDNSSDSRIWGFVPEELLISKVFNE